MWNNARQLNLAANALHVLLVLVLLAAARLLGDPASGVSPARDPDRRRHVAHQFADGARRRGGALEGQLLHRRSRCGAHRVRTDAVGASRERAARVAERAGRDAGGVQAARHVGQRSTGERGRRVVHREPGRTRRRPARVRRPGRHGERSGARAIAISRSGSRRSTRTRKK